MPDDHLSLGALRWCNQLILTLSDKLFIEMKAFPAFNGIMVLHTAAFNYTSHGVLGNDHHTPRKLHDGYMPARTHRNERCIEQGVYCEENITLNILDASLWPNYTFHISQSGKIQYEPSIPYSKRLINNNL